LIWRKERRTGKVYIENGWGWWCGVMWLVSNYCYRFTAVIIADLPGNGKWEEKYILID
jgi:hypothetical protein